MTTWAYVVYDDGDEAVLWHQRLVLGRLGCSASEHVVLTPDHDMFVEDLSLANEELAQVQWGTTFNVLPLGIPAAQVYRFAAAPNAVQMTGLRAEAELMADNEDRVRLAFAGPGAQLPPGPALVGAGPAGGQVPGLPLVVPGAAPAGVGGLAAFPGGVVVAGGAGGGGVAGGAVAAGGGALALGAPAGAAAGGAVAVAIPGTTAGGAVWRAAMSLGGVAYGDPVQVDAAAVGRAVFGRSVMDMGNGEGLFVELVEPADLQDFLERLVRSEARVLPVRTRRHRSWESIANGSRLENFNDWPLPLPRTVPWCFDFLRREGETIERHRERFRSICKLDSQMWGVSEHFQLCQILKLAGEYDQNDLANSAAYEAVFRRV